MGVAVGGLVGAGVGISDSSITADDFALSRSFDNAVVSVISTLKSKLSVWSIVDFTVLATSAITWLKSVLLADSTLLDTIGTKVFAFNKELLSEAIEIEVEFWTIFSMFEAVVKMSSFGVSLLTDWFTNSWTIESKTLFVVALPSIVFTAFDNVSVIKLSLELTFKVVEFWSLIKSWSTEYSSILKASAIKLIDSDIKESNSLTLVLVLIFDSAKPAFKEVMGVMFKVFELKLVVVDLVDIFEKVVSIVLFVIESTPPGKNSTL